MGKDLRIYLDKLKKVAPEELIRVKREVDINFETSQVVAKLESLNSWKTACEDLSSLYFIRLHKHECTLITNNVFGFDMHPLLERKPL